MYSASTLQRRVYDRHIVNPMETFKLYQVVLSRNKIGKWVVPYIIPIATLKVWHSCNQYIANIIILTQKCTGAAKKKWEKINDYTCIKLQLSIGNILGIALGVIASEHTS